jgi:aclacinomycin oxidase
VTIPAGESPTLGLGAHVSGGGFGFLCRQHGLAADHLYGLEVVVVDADGTARKEVATREPSDPNRDLWWAHTGAGGGNFGIVTRCWFRSPDVSGHDPALRLPRAPDSILLFRLAWSWDDMDVTSFARLATNFGDWCERNGDASSPFARLFSTLFLWRRQLGKLELKGLSTAGVEADRLVDEHIAAITRGIGAPHTRSLERTSWVNFALNPFPELFAPVGSGALFKGKDAFLRKRFTDRQIETAHQ